jgi:hypothetical protein
MKKAIVAAAIAAVLLFLAILLGASPVVPSGLNNATAVNPLRTRRDRTGKGEYRGASEAAL